MKRIIIIFFLLLIPCFLFADVDTMDGTAITTSSSIDGETAGKVDGQTIVSGALCSSCNPGDPQDIYCEDWEDSDQEWCTWTDVIDSGNSATQTSHSGSLNCGEKGSYALEATATFAVGEAASDEAAKYTSLSSESPVYQAFYWYYDGASSSTDSGTYMGISSFWSASHAAVCTIYFWNDGGTAKLRMKVHTTTDDEWVAGPTLSTGWYFIEHYWIKNTSNGSWFAVTPAGGSRTQYSASENETTINNDIARYYTGFWGDVGWTSGDTLTAQWEMLQMDDDTMPGACSGF